MPDIRPFRSNDENDVINLFAWSGAIPVNKGTFVKVVPSSGWQTSTTDLESLGQLGGGFNNTQALRYGTVPKVTTASTGDVAIGMLLWSVKEVDENGQLLKYLPRKAAEMQVALSGQTVPIVTRGLFLYSGVIEAVTAGTTAYVSGGTLTPTNPNPTFSSGIQFQSSTAGTFLGGKDGNGWCLVKINCQ